MLTTLNIPFVAVRTPSVESNRSSSHNSSPSRHLSCSSAHTRQQRSRSNTRMSVRETVKSLFRSSKTVDSMSSTTNVQRDSTNPERIPFQLSNTMFISSLGSNQLSHSQPIVTDSSMNDHMQNESPFIGHTEQTPLIDRRRNSKPSNPMKTSFDDSPEMNGKESIRLNRNGLHLPLDNDGLQRSRSCTDDIIITNNNGENDATTHGMLNGTMNQSNLQANHGEVMSLHSSDSATSSLSAYLPCQTAVNGQIQTSIQTNGDGKNDLDKSQESLFSLSSPTHKQRSFKSLLIASNNKDPSTKQGNDVLFLIATWVLRSPEDFQGRKRMNVFI